MRGLFPGGHTVQVQMPGAVLRRSALIGIPWPMRPLVVRVRDVEQAQTAARDGADLVLYEGADVSLAADIVLSAHANGARVALTLPGSGAIAQTGADAVWARTLDSETKRRFPETRELIPSNSPTLLEEVAAAADRASFDRLLATVGVVEVPRPALAPLGLLAPGGIVVDPTSLDLVKARKRQTPLREGKTAILIVQNRRAVVTFRAGHQSLLWVANLDPSMEWRFVPEGVSRPLDLLGGALDGDAIRIRPGDFSLIVQLPGRDPSRL